MQRNRRLPWIVAGSAMAVFAMSHASGLLHSGPSPAHAAQAPAQAQAEAPDAQAAQPVSAAPMRKPREAPTHAELLGQLETHIRTLDAGFAAEPLDAAWATRGEAAIAAFFAPDALAADGLAAPAALKRACHSASCRISMRFANAADAEMATQALAMRLGDTLPYGAVMPRELPDGSIEVNAWYSAQPLRL